MTWWYVNSGRAEPHGFLVFPPPLANTHDPPLCLQVHDADFIMHLLNDTPHKVYAKGSSFHPELQAIQVLDNAHCMLEFQSGVVATIELSRASAYGYVKGNEGQAACFLHHIPHTYPLIHAL